MALAEEFGGEIISCDSVQVYRGFEIGCAKPTSEERARIPHHLLDVVEWNQPFDAQQFADAAAQEIIAIRRRGALPIVCGGTGLYLRALRWGLIELPASDPKLRAEMEREELEAPGSLLRRLASIDPESARTVDSNNLVHIMRAIEIYELSGEPASLLRAKHGFSKERLPMKVFAVDRETADLRGRIVERTREMLNGGLFEEVERLLQAGVSSDCRPMRAVGYREVIESLEGVIDKPDLAEKIRSSTWAYARRQRTWLRKERAVQTVMLSDAKIPGVISTAARQLVEVLR
jgi:tRNA dimethylallyltransferase